MFSEILHIFYVCFTIFLSLFSFLFSPATNPLLFSLFFHYSNFYYYYFNVLCADALFSSSAIPGRTSNKFLHQPIFVFFPFSFPLYVSLFLFSLSLFFIFSILSLSLFCSSLSLSLFFQLLTLSFSAIPGITSNKFLPLFYQIASRLNHTADTANFQKVLNLLIDHTIVKHPHHSLYQVSQISFYASKTYRITEKCKNKVEKEKKLNRCEKQKKNQKDQFFPFLLFLFFFLCLFF